MNHYSIILEVLTRLRQICDHYKLCEHRLNSLIEFNQKEIADMLNNEDLQGLYRILQTAIESNDDCCICLETLARPIVTPCRHVFDKGNYDHFVNNYQIGYRFILYSNHHRHHIKKDCIEKVLAKKESCHLCRKLISRR